MDKLTDTILNNIQVSIKGIHIRYEDKMTNPEHPFACGVMLKGLTAETTNNQWQPVQIDGDATEVHKVRRLLSRRSGGSSIGVGVFDRRVVQAGGGGDTNLRNLGCGTEKCGHVDGCHAKSPRGIIFAEKGRSRSEWRPLEGAEVRTSQKSGRTLCCFPQDSAAYSVMATNQDFCTETFGALLALKRTEASTIVGGRASG